MIEQRITCEACNSEFYTDYSTGENLDLDNYSPVCPDCQHCKNQENFEKPVDKNKTRSKIDKTKFKKSSEGDTLTGGPSESLGDMAD